MQRSYAAGSDERAQLLEEFDALYEQIKKGPITVPCIVDGKEVRWASPFRWVVYSQVLATRA